VYCVTVAFTHLFPFNGDFSFGKNQKSQGAKSGLYGGLTDLGDVILYNKSLHESCRMGRRIVLSSHSVIVNATVTQYISSVNGVSLPTN